MSKKELSRAELVRMRREKEHTQQLQRASKVAARPTPTVTARKKSPTKPVRKPVQNARRRFQIALPHLPRTDIRSISIPRPRVGWRLFSFIFALLLGVAIYLAFNLPELRVTEARLYGNQQLTQAELNATLNVSGQPIFLITPSELETRLRLNYPELASVRVTVGFPNVVSVDVTERQAVIRWEQGGGYTWVSADGIAFRPRGELVGLIPVVALSAPPVVGGGSDPLTPAPFISAELVRTLNGLYGHVPTGAPILYEKDNGFGWNDPRGWRVYFGTSSNDVELKMRVYESMVASLTQRGIRPALINVMYPTAPYYRMSQ
ncbi:MAG: FtsQ-type POTRA domain-containing protein [Anaerolineales bacterium]|nr:FtsQ-type POTRA domain-containing protein [Anaerolineales bacterium]